MRNTLLGYSVLGAKELQLDVVDLTILRWFDDFRNTGCMVFKNINNETYYWISYNKIIEDIPILYVKKRVIYNRLRAMVDKNILKKAIVKQFGVYTFFALGENYRKLFNQ